MHAIRTGNPFVLSTVTNSDMPSVPAYIADAVEAHREASLFRSNIPYSSDLAPPTAIRRVPARELPSLGSQLNLTSLVGYVVTVTGTAAEPVPTAIGMQASPPRQADSSPSAADIIRGSRSANGGSFPR